MDRATITCIVLNWNGGQESVDCVSSLLASKQVGVSVVVVDNGSVDGSDRRLADRFPKIMLLRNQKNLGVAKAWNAGVRWGLDQGSHVVFLLNNDAVVDPFCLVTLLHATAEDPKVGIVSPRILDGREPGKVWFDGGIINTFGDTVHRDFGRVGQVGGEVFTEDFSSGCAMLIRAEVFDQVGFFDESFFAYSEDADFCLRAKAKGFAVVHKPQALATHFPSAATIKNRGKWFRDYYVTRNKLLLVRRYRHGLQWILFLLYFTWKHVAIPITYFAVTGQLKRIGAVISGVGDFLRNRFGERYS